MYLDGESKAPAAIVNTCPMFYFLNPENEITKTTVKAKNINSIGEFFICCRRLSRPLKVKRAGLRLGLLDKISQMRPHFGSEIMGLKTRAAGLKPLIYLS
ncbi:hypothetical protein [Methylophaga nitratireducenticrescens]|uniref:hypothetical protein n=1 Tax=Methylophaga nitratireducenticrescens TaxID=754476 RepID=UPI00069611C0|nr:hypothetical protein [Methylophaga nitratireducenticrescens]ASF49154.1 hypothetical protein Q7A_03775 [Methylophaga nitratireducenticrescens]AUZ85273.1 hypothetical protein CDW43_12155 [Methylophaga nitratireducenticrescens]